MLLGMAMQIVWPDCVLVLQDPRLQPAERPPHPGGHPVDLWGQSWYL